ncbi:MAG: hypothetical protein KJ967_00535 [Elusimicrobia bacterium]|nr:hypothetical protein [Elusimicrobiota bacterium]
MNATSMTKAIALYSGGLDSTLAVLVLLQQNIDIIAINFTTPFGCSVEDKSSCSKASDSVADAYGFVLKYFPLGQTFVEMVKNPKHGHGRNMNPCIDCRILMLKEAKRLMAQCGADFIVTGEVLRQRPMSQNLPTLKLIEQEAGLEGLLLRPLSAKLLEETIPEKKGLVDRQKLYGFSSRSRKPQIQLAGTFGLKDIPQPAGGCLLTDPLYSKRLRDYFTHEPAGTQPRTQNDTGGIPLLKIGRHFRFSEKSKLIVGRNHDENVKIRKYWEENKNSGVLLSTGEPFPGPTAILITDNHKNIREEIETSAGIVARYSDEKNSASVPVDIADFTSGNNREKRLNITPADDGSIAQLRI